MTSLTTSTSPITQPSSPRARMTERIAAAASTGAISATDQTALDNALDSIGSSLASAPSNRSATGGSMKDRIDSLIDAQTSAGKLTDDQASELKGFFAQGPQRAGAPSSSAGGDTPPGSIEGVSGAHAAGHVHGGHVHHAHGAGGAAPTADSSDDDAPSDPLSLTGTTAGTDSTATSTAGSSAADQLDTMIALLEKLRASVTSSDSYSPSGSGSASNGLVLNGLA